MKVINEMPSPRIFKSHNPYHMMAGGVPHTSPAKYIYIARNPKDTAVSFYYHMCGFIAIFTVMGALLQIVYEWDSGLWSVV